MSQTAIEDLLYDFEIACFAVAHDQSGPTEKAEWQSTKDKLTVVLHAKAGVSVKPLEWILKDDFWRAECIGHVYEVFNDDNADYKKRQCQFDFNARIRSALSTKLQEPVGETQATVYDWEFTNPETGKWDYARTPEKAQKLIEAGIKVTPVYTIEQVNRTLAHQPVTAGWEKAMEALEPFAKVGRIIDGPFGPALFAEDDATFQSGCAWTENGERKTLTWGQFRRAAEAYADLKSEGRKRERVDMSKEGRKLTALDPNIDDDNGGFV